MSDAGDTPASPRPLPSTKPASVSSPSSSIGKKSDDDIIAADAGEEADSQASRISLDTLEDALPIRKGLSAHHDGKTKSYSNLADAASDSSIAKPLDPYSKKRQYKIAREIYMEGMGQGPMNKKPTNASRSTAPIKFDSGINSQDAKSTESGSSDEKSRSTAPIKVDGTGINSQDAKSTESGSSDEKSRSTAPIKVDGGLNGQDDAKSIESGSSDEKTV